MTVTGNVKQHGTSYTTTFHMLQMPLGKPKAWDSD